MTDKRFIQVDYIVFIHVKKNINYIDVKTKQMNILNHTSQKYLQLIGKFVIWLEKGGKWLVIFKEWELCSTL